MELRDAACHLCRYWKDNHMYPYATDNEMWQLVGGDCRARPPQRSVQPTVIENVMTWREWPVTRGDDWCGSFAATEGSR